MFDGKEEEMGRDVMGKEKELGLQNVREGKREERELGF